MKTKILAHRGASTLAPENTLEAFRLAIEQGADGIELDVHLTKDGEIAVFHDLTLERMTNGTGRICDYTMAELKKLTVGNSCKIPTLNEVFNLTESHKSPLTVNVELKTTEELYPALPQKLTALQHKLTYTEIIYSSFNHYSLKALRQLNPDAQIGLLYNLPLADPHIYAQHLQATAIHPPWQIIAALPHIVSDCHTLGIQVNTWTINDPAHIKALLACGVDAIITDVPDAAMPERDRF
jgi:glycerophosphoryl diester phosphodiesterase